MASPQSLRDFQRRLSARLASASTTELSSTLGLQAGNDRWLINLEDAGEVLPVPALAKPKTPLPDVLSLWNHPP